jgi:hypothetical protein
MSVHAVHQAHSLFLVSPAFTFASPSCTGCALCAFHAAPNKTMTGATEDRRGKQGLQTPVVDQRTKPLQTQWLLRRMMKQNP